MVKPGSADAVPSEESATSPAAAQPLAKGPAGSPARAPAGVEAGNIDKIRDILFGNQVRDFDRRFARFEQHLAEVTADLRADVCKRIDALEAYFKAELGATRERLREESIQRVATQEQLAESIKAVASTLENKLQASTDQTSEHLTELRQRILEQSKQLSEEIQSRYERTTAGIAAAADRLEQSKLDRSTFSESLTDLAMRISAPQDSDARGSERA